jgi:hypothetical protein
VVVDDRWDQHDALGKSRHKCRRRVFPRHAVDVCRRVGVCSAAARGVGEAKVVLGVVVEVEAVPGAVVETMCGAGEADAAHGMAAYPTAHG